MGVVEQQPVLASRTPEPVRQSRPGVRRLSRFAPVAVPAALAAAFYGVFIARTAFTFQGRTSFALFDDAMISMRYGENLAHGHGLVYNAGAPAVEGYTNFLWTLYMALVHALPISMAKTSLVVEITSAVLLLGCGFLAGAIAKLMVPRSRALVAVVAAATSFFFPLVFWALRGMEVGLATLLVLALVLAALRLEQAFTPRRLVGMAALGAAAVLVRDDLALPTIVAFTYVLLRSLPQHRRRTATVLFGTLAATIAGHEVFRLAYYGNLLPNTYYLKLSGTSLHTRALRGLYVVAGTFVLTLCAPVAVAISSLWRRSSRRDPRVLLLAAVAASQVLYTIYVGGDAWEPFLFADRFLTPAAPLLFVLAAVALHRLSLLDRGVLAGAALVLLAGGLVAAFVPAHGIAYWLGDSKWTSTLHSTAGRFLPMLVAAALVAALYAGSRMPSIRRRGGPAVLLLAVGALLLLVVPNARLYSGWIKSNATSVQNQNGALELGAVLRTLTRPQDSIALSSAGAIAYSSGRPAVDLLGVNDVRISHEPPKDAHFLPGHTKWDYPYSIAVLRPQVVYGLFADDPAAWRLLRSLGYEPAQIRISAAQAPDLPTGTVVFLSRDLAQRVRRERSTAAGAASFQLVQWSPSTAPTQTQ